ncbi:MAG: hypothetical protein ACFE9R_14940, partial [Candidatus Hermodarchaeota archaeon]
IFFMAIGIILFLIIVINYTISQKKGRKIKDKSESVHPNSFRSIDGHKVRSKGELIIDNFLYLSGLKHDYEKKLTTNFGIIVPDWYLPSLDIYIEYWGFSGERYERRKKEKLDFYERAKLIVISIDNSMFDDIYLKLGRILNQFTRFENNIKFFQKKKYCSNCGTLLDERF